MKQFGVFLLWCLFLSVVTVSANDTWRNPDNENILIMQLDSGQVIIELAPQFAPKHVSNIKTLVQQKYFDGTAILRSQDNYVVQWGDQNDQNNKAKSLGKAQKELNTEFYRSAKDVNYSRIKSRDAYAEEVGFVDGFPVASDGERVWLAHCYGMLGVSRGMAENSGNGSGLYVVTGHAPRHLDLNVTLVGRVLKGMDLLSSLPRGTGSLGFYETPEEYVAVRSIVSANTNEALGFTIMNTDSMSFKQHVIKRTNRTQDWFLEPTGKIELCNVGVPINASDVK